MALAPRVYAINLGQKAPGPDLPEEGPGALVARRRAELLIRAAESEIFVFILTLTKFSDLPCCEHKLMTRFKWATLHDLAANLPNLAVGRHDQYATAGLADIGQLYGPARGNNMKAG